MYLVKRIINNRTFLASAALLGNMFLVQHIHGHPQRIVWRDSGAALEIHMQLDMSYQTLHY